MTATDGLPTTVYQDCFIATIRFRDRVMGATPRDPRVIEGWLKAKAGIDSAEELRRMTLRTLQELGTVPEDATEDDLEQAIAQIARTKQTNGFKRDPELGLYLESRIVKAAIKEATNILYAGDRWGPTRKGPKQFVAERIFCLPDRLFLGRQEPDGIDLFVGHVSGPSGKQATLTYHEYVVNATIQVGIKCVRNSLTHEQWMELWELMAENGLGALRSQGYGRFTLVGWERVSKEELTRWAMKQDPREQRDVVLAERQAAAALAADGIGTT